MRGIAANARRIAIVLLLASSGLSLVTNHPSSVASSTETTLTHRVVSYYSPAGSLTMTFTVSLSQSVVSIGDRLIFTYVEVDRCTNGPPPSSGPYARVHRPGFAYDSSINLLLTANGPAADQLRKGLGRVPYTWIDGRYTVKASSYADRNFAQCDYARGVTTEVVTFRGRVAKHYGADPSGLDIEKGGEFFVVPPTADGRYLGHKNQWWGTLPVLKILPKPSGPLAAYAAFGDSITTGFSIATCGTGSPTPHGCTEDRSEQPPARPYPDLIAGSSPHYRPERRVGMWGETLANAVTPPAPQLAAIESATSLVTGALGINDVRFSELGLWIDRCLGDLLRCHFYAKDAVAALDPFLDRLFSSLQVAKERGATVVITLYYNPYDSENPNCSELSAIADTIVGALDDELEARAHAAGFLVADLRTVFAGHGAGSKDPYVDGWACSIDGALSAEPPPAVDEETKKSAAIYSYMYSASLQGFAPVFDPHPNSRGTRAIADLILSELATVPTPVLGPSS